MKMIYCIKLNIISRKHVLCLLIFLGITQFSTLFSQTGLKVGEFPGLLAPSAIFEAESTTRGVLVPRMTTAQMNAISSPTLGLLVFNTDANCLYFYVNGWKSQCDPANLGAWSLLGNAGISSNNFLGSINNASLRFRTNNSERMIVDSLGNVGIGVISPTSRLHTAETNTSATSNYSSLLNDFTVDITANPSSSATLSSMKGNVILPNTNNSTLSNLKLTGGVFSATYSGTGTINSLNTITSTSVNNGILSSSQHNLIADGTNSGTTANFRGFNFSLTNDGNVSSEFHGGRAYLVNNGTARYYTGYHSWLTNGTNANITTGIYNLSIRFTNNSVNTVPAYYGFYSGNFTNTGTVANTYAVYVADITSGTQTNTPYSFYASDVNAYNYFAGNTGIGITNPQYRLDIDANTGSSGNPLRLLGLQAGTTTDSLVTSQSGVLKRLAINQLGTGNFWKIGGNTEGGVRNLGTTDNYDLPFITNNVERMRINTSGYLGLNTTTPTARLTLRQSASGWGDGIRLENVGGANYYTILNDGTSNFFSIAANSDYTKSLVLSATTGNIGIGLNTPSAKLDILSDQTTIGVKIAKVTGVAGQPQIFLDENRNTGGMHQKGIFMGLLGIPATEIGSMYNNTTLSYFFIDTDSANIGAGNSHINPAFTITRTKNIGINTNNPIYKLDIDANTGSSGNPLRLQGLQAGATTDSLVTSQSGVLKRLAINQLGTGNFWKIGGNTEGGVRNLGTTDNYDLPFITNNVECMRINTSGYVGVGTTSPSGRIHISSGLTNSLFDPNYNNLVIEGTGTQGIQFLSPTGGLAGISWSRFGSYGALRMHYDHSNDNLYWDFSGNRTIKLSTNSLIMPDGSTGNTRIIMDRSNGAFGAYDAYNHLRFYTGVSSDDAYLGLWNTSNQQTLKLNAASGGSVQVGNYKVYSLNRTLGPNDGDYVNIGKINTVNGMFHLEINMLDGHSGGGSSKKVILLGNWDQHATTTWREVLPISTSGPRGGSDYVIDYGGQYDSLRIRRIGNAFGGNSTNIVLSIYLNGNDVLTENSASGNNAFVSGYFMSNSVITQIGNSVGINMRSPAYKLDINANTGSSGNPLRLQGLQAGATSDSLLSSASGVVRRLAPLNSTTWALSGNSGTNASTNFLGTTDNVDMVLRTANVERMRIYSGGIVDIQSSYLDAGATGAGPGLIYRGGFMTIGDVNNNQTYANGLGIKFNDAGVQHASISYLPNSSLLQFGRTSNHGNLLPFDTRATLSLNVSSNNVGINTSAPAYKLDIDANTGSTGNPLRLQGLQAGATSDSLLSSVSGVVRRLAINQLGTGNFWKIGGNTEGGVRNLGTSDNFALPFITNNAERMRITEAGNVGIGTTTPTNLLDIYNGSLRLYNAVGDLFKLDYGSGNLQVGGGNQDGDIEIRDLNGNTKTWFSGFAGLANYINNGGNLGIGCTNPNYKLHVVGDIAAQGGTLRAVSATVSTTITACSDIRFKDNIVPLSNALDNVLKIQGVTYDWRVKEFPERYFNNKKQIGIIAQEVEKVYPELVETDDRGYKSVDYTKLTPILVEAIKEQEQKITVLEAENKVIKEQIIHVTDLKKSNDDLRQMLEKQNELNLLLLKRLEVLEASMQPVKNK